MHGERFGSGQVGAPGGSNLFETSWRCCWPSAPETTSVSCVLAIRSSLIASAQGSIADLPAQPGLAEKRG